MPNAWYQLGQLKEPLSPAEAQKCYQEALRLNPRHAGAMQKLGPARAPGLAQPTGVPGPTSAPSPSADRGAAAYASQTAGDAGQWFADAPLGHIRGRVVGFQRRAEQSFYLHRLYLYVWDFRVEQPGMAPVMVEMRGFRFRGDISNGDIVDIVATDYNPGRVLKVRRAHQPDHQRRDHYVIRPWPARTGSRIKDSGSCRFPRYSGRYYTFLRTYI